MCLLIKESNQSERGSTRSRPRSRRRSRRRDHQDHGRTSRCINRSDPTRPYLAISAPYLAIRIGCGERHLILPCREHMRALGGTHSAANASMNSRADAPSNHLRGVSLLSFVCLPPCSSGGDLTRAHPVFQHRKHRDMNRSKKTTYQSPPARTAYCTKGFAASADHSSDSTESSWSKEIFPIQIGKVLDNPHWRNPSAWRASWLPHWGKTSMVILYSNYIDGSISIPAKQQNEEIYLKNGRRQKRTMAIKGLSMFELLDGHCTPQVLPRPRPLLPSIRRETSEGRPSIHLLR